MKSSPQEIFRCGSTHGWQEIEEDLTVTSGSGSTTTIQNQNTWGLGYVDALVARYDNSSSGSYGKTSSGQGSEIFVQQDANFNVTSLSSTAGAIIERFIYDPYGSFQVLTSAWASTTDSYNWKYLFQGLAYDSTTGLYNGRNRMYSPTLGRWMQMDPAGYINGGNLYQFVDSTPVALTDPFGLAAEENPAAGEWDIKTVETNIGTFTVPTKPFSTDRIGGPAGLQAGIKFMPDKKKCPKCKKIRLVHVIRFTDPNGKHEVPSVQKGFENLMTTEDKAKGVDAGWIIDFNGHGQKKGTPVSPYYNDNFPNEFKKDASNDGANPESAGMYDAPYSQPKEERAKFEAEVYAICIDTGAVLGGLSWGFTIGDDFKASATAPKGIDKASQSFIAAKAEFDSFFGNK